MGKLCFGFEENCQFVQAETAGTKALEHTPQDIWAIHSMAHVYEETSTHLTPDFPFIPQIIKQMKHVIREAQKGSRLPRGMRGQVVGKQLPEDARGVAQVALPRAARGV